MLEQYVKKILEAPVYDVAVETPLQAAPLLSRRTNNHVWLKREDLQPVFSFKLRGAYNRVTRLSEQQKKRGVICASAGNHAQGLALAAAHLGIKAVIVMPCTTPAIKVDAVRARGGKVVLHGDTFDDALKHARLLEAADRLTFVHPYDDVDVIAGQGTVAMEIIRQHGPLDVVFVPVGGGGLAAGMAAYIKYLRPSVKVIAVEPHDAACLQAALQRGRRVNLSEVGIFVDGAAVRQIGHEPFKVLRKTVDEVITADTDEVCAAIKDIFEDTRAVAEPAGALALAGLKKYAARNKTTGLNLLAVVSGANVNFDRLRHISERAELGEQREALIAVTIPEKPGAFKTFCRVLGRRSITEFNYRYSHDKLANIFVGVQTGQGSGLDRLLADLHDKNYPAVNLSGDEMSKLHIRHMVGGHTPLHLNDEVLFRVQFPERPGALLDFLSTLGSRWNISLFHYRNHGAAYGRVLVGFQAAPSERARLRADLKKVPYPVVEESNNEAYRLFLNQSAGEPGR